MASGRVVRCVLPPAVVTVSGKPAAAEPDCAAPAPAEETLAGDYCDGHQGRQLTGDSPHDHPPCAGGRSALRCDARRHRNEPPFLRGQVAGTGQASGLVLRRRHHRCGTAPGSHRLRWEQHLFRTWARNERSLPQSLDHRVRRADCRQRVVLADETKGHNSPSAGARSCRAANRRRAKQPGRKLLWPLHLIPGGACAYCPAARPITSAATRRPNLH